LLIDVFQFCSTAMARMRRVLVSLTALTLLLLWDLPRLRATTIDRESSEQKTCDWKNATTQEECNNNNDEDKNNNRLAAAASRTPHPHCRVVLAPTSSEVGVSGGYGVFSLQKLHRGQAVLPGDLVIHIVDYDFKIDAVDDDDDDYWWRWSAEDTGGMYEGTGGRVAVHAPGLALLANHQHNYSNVLPGVPRVDEAGLTRAEYPGSGAITHYHNWTFYVQAAVIEPGEELLVRHHHGRSTSTSTSTTNTAPPTVTASSNNKDDDQDGTRTTTSSTRHSSSQRNSVEWLRANGWCLDNTRPIHFSKYRQAGRGLVTRRALPAGAVVLPVPLRAIRRDSLRIQRHNVHRRDDTMDETEQLLINYCFGHIDSSILLYSYGPMVKYVR
jgi:hypothetical protein